MCYGFISIKVDIDGSFVVILRDNSNLELVSFPIHEILSKMSNGDVVYAFDINHFKRIYDEIDDVLEFFNKTISKDRLNLGTNLIGINGFIFLTASDNSNYLWYKDKYYYFKPNILTDIYIDKGILKIKTGGMLNYKLDLSSNILEFNGMDISITTATLQEFKKAVILSRW